ncbi:MAG: ribosome small subunit-dependent GTPase A [Clostridia bacterium]|nr:ribosome small subunit-dependent GTPase A [Clostridia bacterium]
MEGWIVRGVGGFYYVTDAEGSVYELRAQAKFRRQKLKPVTGDRVRFTPGPAGENGWVEEILPRRNLLVRPPVANIDRAVVQVSASVPKADLLLADRLLLAAFRSEIEPVLVVNKSDLAPEEALAIARQYRGCGIGAFAVSAAAGTGLQELRSALAGRISAFCGQSGVGKSTLINALYGFRLNTGDLSGKIARGRHTTRHTELRPTPDGGMVLDTPGFSLLSGDLMEPVELKQWYPEFLPYEGMCRFEPCAHDREPDCAVRKAVQDGAIDRQRYERYRTLLEETRIRWRERYD